MAEVWIRERSGGLPRVLSASCVRTSVIWTQELQTVPLALFRLDGEVYCVARQDVKAGYEYMVIALSRPGLPRVVRAELGGCC
jgi:hypothetical protein